MMSFHIFLFHIEAVMGLKTPSSGFLRIVDWCLQINYHHVNSMHCLRYELRCTQYVMHPHASAQVQTDTKDTAGFRISGS